MTNQKSTKYINWETEEIQPVNSHWILPQLCAQIGAHWPLVRVDGTISPTQTIRRWSAMSQEGSLTLDGTVVTHPGLKKLVSWLNTSPRGDILTGLTQTKDPGVRWSAPVPIVLSMFKEMRGVGYDLWNWRDPNIQHLVDRDIWDWSGHFYVDHPWSPDQLLSFRVKALEVKTGRLQGTVRKPESTAQVYGVTDPDFKKLPRLMKLALCQLWCFHPRVRTNLMITNHMDLDNHPPPLVDSEVVHKPTNTEPSPWDV